MKETLTGRKLYEAPKLVEYGDIRKLTSAASLCAGAMDSMYYMGHIISLGGCPEHSSHHTDYS